MCCATRLPGLLALFLISITAPGQTTQGLVSGTVTNIQNGEPIQGATISATRLTAEASVRDAGAAVANDQGRYTVPFLTPGTFHLRVEAAGFQAQEIAELDLAVASRLERDFALRPLDDVWETDFTSRLLLPGQSTIVHYYAADVESLRPAAIQLLPANPSPLQATLSYVIDARSLESLPLAGRDVYTALVMQPGIAADGATTRGLGLAANGQRPAASNFLLDGVENNNYLITGPLNTLPPEAIQEYRISTNNFSAEFGRTGGYIANAVTRSGGGSFHGLVYAYLNNKVLNANTFQRNLAGLEREPRKEIYTGLSLGGPVVPDRLFFGATFERFGSRNREAPVEFLVPVVERFRACPSIAADSQGMRLLDQYAPPPATPPPLQPGQTACDSLGAPLMAEPTVTTNRYLTLARLDFATPGSVDRFTIRFVDARRSQPDFLYSLYRDFNLELADSNTGVALNYTRTLSPTAVNELRTGWRYTDLHWDRPHPEFAFHRIPIQGILASLPGSEAAYEFRNSGNSWDLADSLVVTRGRHVLTVGGGLLFRTFYSNLTLARDGFFTFPSLLAFGTDSPSFFTVAVDKETFPPPGATGFQSPSFDRDLANLQFFGFVQDDFRATRRLVLNFGARYESFGANRNTGVRDAVVVPGPGATIEERITGASLDFNQAGRTALYQPDRNNWAARFGLSHDLTGGGKALFRGGYGVFFDPGLDNLWQDIRNNSIATAQTNRPFDYSRSLTEILPTLPANSDPLGFPEPVWIDEKVRTPYVQNWFTGIQFRPTRELELEVSHAGSTGRRLIVSDFVNRRYSAAKTEESPNGRLNPEFPDILYRSNSGSSTHTALIAMLRYRSARSVVQAGYTWGHTIDNQSDALRGHFSDLSFAQVGRTGDATTIATFTRQFDSRVDRANADFDQRHNLVISTVWDLPGAGSPGWLSDVLGGWRFAQLAGFRTGFHYTVLAANLEEPASGGELYNKRPQLTGVVDPILSPGEPVPGGLRIVDDDAFAEPGATLGNSGRNNLAAPGFWNVDISLARTLPLPKLGESGRLVLRIDGFNVFNHANLGNPLPNLFLGERFGEASYGRRGLASSFPAALPLSESGRQVQVQVKVLF